MEEKWLEAADAYDFFIRFHPVHEKLPYAYFKVAQANFNAMPSDFFLYPRSYTKDQTATKEALAALDKYLQMFPNDANVKEAKEMRVKLRDQAALLHVHVARFYITLRKWRGAAQRFDEVVKSFADTPSAKAAMLELAYIKKDRLEQIDEAKALLERLTTEFADSAEAAKAKSLLHSLEPAGGSAKAGS
jgi:outer membrane protein assembly factor BamD